MSAPANARPLGQRVTGPSALAGGPRRFLHLTWTIAVQEFKLRFFGSALGYLWQLMRPILLFAVLYVVLTQAVRIGGGARYFPAVLLTNVLLFTFFADATGGAVTSVVDRENLVRKVYFPRLVVPAAVVLTAAFNLATNLAAVAVLVLASGVQPRLGWLELPLLLLALATLATGCAMLLSALYVRFRDLRPIWEVTLQVVFYATPIIYVIERIDSVTLRHVMMANPLAAILEQVRHAVIDPSAPSAAAAIGGWGRLVVPAGIVVGVFALGFRVFNRAAPGIAEDL